MEGCTYLLSSKGWHRAGIKVFVLRLTSIDACARLLRRSLPPMPSGLRQPILCSRRGRDSMRPTLGSYCKVCISCYPSTRHLAGNAFTDFSTSMILIPGPTSPRS